MTTPHDSDAAVWEAYRRWGYLSADLDWLDRLPPLETPDLPSGSDASEEAHGVYCGTVGVEFMHMPFPERRQWIAERMESPAPAVDRAGILQRLVRAATFEQLLQTQYLGNKRFSIEGLEALVPLLCEMLEVASGRDTAQVVMAMSHRGRLNVMLNVVGRDPSELFAGFEDVDPRSILGAGDVKYHMGATGTYESRDGGSIGIHLVSNPSHLEAVNPVAMGRVRAKLTRLGDPTGEKVVPIIMHGDAAFAGQGITAETLNLAEIEGFEVGGTVQVIVNNLIGFTAEPKATHSSRFASDVARRLPIPIFHVNAEDPDAVARVAQLAMQYRYEFRSDVVVDLIGYRKHGHSEIDDPTITQPKLYAAIKERPPLWQSYAERLGGNAPEKAAEFAAETKEELTAAKDQAAERDSMPTLRKLPGYWSGFVGGPYKPDLEVETGLTPEDIVAITERLVSTPEDFHVHPKVQKLLDQRMEMARGERQVDYGYAEVLAYGALVRDGHPVRISGQDSRRGTFNHRHAVLIDAETGGEYCPLQHISEDQARFEIYDSVLSEAAVLGYEYGYSRDYPEALVAWEAQFGDFANGAQVIFDQFVTAGEDKWGLLSGLTVLLPHGFEGQGPEHSSARIERFLQLAAEDAIQVAQPSSAAQHFHLLRRQAMRKWRKPLIVFTPKSMLRHKAANSLTESLTRDRFLEVMPDPAIDEADRILICSGKIVHELRAKREALDADRVAILTLEQLYPFPDAALGVELDRYESARQILWVQEEPANMGALFFVQPRIERISRGRHVRTVKRSASASPATGSSTAHQLEQSTLIELAFR